MPPAALAVFIFLDICVTLCTIDSNGLFPPVLVIDMYPNISETIEPRGWNVDMAARYTGLTISTLNKLRCRGDGPRFIRLAPMRVAYLREDLDAWLDGLPKCSTTADAFAAPTDA